MRVTNNLYVLCGGHYAAVDPDGALGEVYGITTPDGVILIDCGVAASGVAIAREVLGYFGVKEPITHVLVTHAHHDHCGGAKELQAAGAKIIVGKEDAPCCMAGCLVGSPFEFEAENRFPAFTPDITVDGDSTMELCGISFELIKIPGHTPGSMAIRTRIDGKTALFTGDSIAIGGRSLDDITFGWRGDPAFNRERLLASVLKLCRYETELILPGHGKVCLREGTTALRHAAQTAVMTLR